ncbi:MAG: phosphatase PAP2 family protein [Bacteroidales bacterium]|nr:phosphatase PAP2 family protein [Bacteroidales bacterium]
MNLIELDQQASLWINSFHCPFTDGMWMLFSNIKIWFPFYALVVFFLFRNLGWKKALVILASLIITVVLTDQIANLVKNAVMRPRPCHTQSLLDAGLWCPAPKGGPYGFFSGHASNVFGFALCSSIGFANKKVSKAYVWAVFIWAVLVALSRVFLAAHFLGDILVGALFGLAVGLLMGWLARKTIGWLHLN